MKRWHELRSSAERVAHHTAANHAHHLIYVAYYVFECFEDHGVKLVIVTGLLVFGLLHAVAE